MIDETQTLSVTVHPLSRRALLRTGGLGVGALILAACGQSTAPTSTGTPAGKPTPASTAAAAPQTGAGGPPVKLVFWRHHYDPTDKAYRELVFPDAQAKLGLEFDYQVQRDDDYNLLNSEQGIAAMQNLYDYVFKHGASMLRPQDKESGSAKLPKEETSSTTAMSQWAYGTFRQLAPEKWQNIRSLLAPQVDPSKPRYYSGPGWSYGVFAHAHQREAAFKFLHFVAAEHGSDMFDSGIVAPVVGWTEKYQASRNCQTRMFGRRCHRMPSRWSAHNRRC